MKYTKTNTLAKNNPFHWSCKVIPGREADEYTINYHQCGLCALGRQERLSRLRCIVCWVKSALSAISPIRLLFCTERFRIFIR